MNKLLYFFRLFRNRCLNCGGKVVVDNPYSDSVCLFGLPVPSHCTKCGDKT